MIELLQERPGESLPLQGPEDGRPGTGTRTRMTRVLVAGEHAERQRALRSSLRAGRYHVTTARTGRDALTLAAHRLPDAIILDLSLPDIGGTEVIAKLRRWYQPPIIALSDQTSPGNKIGALDAGADHYLTTPFAMDELMARLRRKLEDNPAHPCYLLTEHGMGYRYQPRGR